jgi:NAD(P)-dependent dehydrogenase (short-subunit alcohol dehydrogenase family)
MMLQEQVAVVTGGGRGLGADYCRALSAEGASVVVADIEEHGARTVAHEVGGMALKVDVSDESSVQSMAADTMSRYGRIDILINNAATFGELRRPPGAFDQIPTDEWDRVIAVNVRGTWLCCAAVAPVFRQQQRGVIVNISSGTIFSGVAGMLPYVTSKAAIWGMTRALARELGDSGVRVNAITPGLTSTDVTREVWSNEEREAGAQRRILKRQETGDDLIGAVLFLCSDASAFITGQTLNIDGGAYLH